MSAAPRPLVVCADDYGLSDAVDAGILELLERRRLNAVSCLSNGPSWARNAARLRAVARAMQATHVTHLTHVTHVTDAAHASGASIGLHLNLTEGEPLGAALRRRWPTLPSLGRVLLRGVLLGLPAACADEADAQWRAFFDAFGAAPSHLDGHQHVHVLRGLREWCVQRQAGARPLWIRSAGRLGGPAGPLKRAVIEHAGGRALDRLLPPAQRVPLLGAYDFSTADYRALMRGWLSRVPPSGAVLFCHPGHAAAGDPIGAARAREHAYLGSDAFTADLHEAGVALHPFPGAPPG